MADKKNLLLLFHRPTEPVFVPKGDKNAVFDIPDHFLPDRYKPIGISVVNRFGEDAGERIPVRAGTVPDLSVPSKLGRRADFSLFIPWHQDMAAALIDLFMSQESIDDLQSVSVYARDRINPQLFNYALSVALLHRPDTRDLPLPVFVESFPEKFMDSAVFQRAREEARVVPEDLRRPIIIPKDYTASDLEPEHRVAYWREDIGVNLHHWHWHLVYPFNASDRSIVAKDRRGELFYYMHEQLIARYNFERLSNKLARVKRFNNFREPISVGYFPKMDSLVSARTWPPRQDNVKWSDIDRTLEQIRLRVTDIERWRDRIYEAIQQGFVIDRSGDRVPLTEMEGIDILGNLVEASLLSRNRELYGDMHNFGHVFTAFIHDPDNRFLERFGVMGDSATAMRDPMFYMWHSFIDDVFQEHKGTLPRYNDAQLDYQGIQITEVMVGRGNTLETFWQQSDIDISRGLDFSPTGAVFVRFTHLQHRPFNYRIVVNNSGAARMGTVRIFIAPKNDERGLPWLFRDQRLMFVELDKFTINMRPGENTIMRRSDESTVTIPFERSFRNLQAGRPDPGTDAEQEFNFCGCGWPHHLLLPKGTPEGLPCDLFVMVSNYEQDKVDQDMAGACNDSAGYCGIRNRLYPDRRSMGFPFDRLPRDGVDTLQQFVTPNMAIVDVSVKFNNVTEQNPKADSQNQPRPGV